MKVVQLTLRFDAPGGVETNVREVTRRLRAMGQDVEVYATDLYDEGRWERRADYAPVVDGVPVRRFPVVKRLVPGLTMPMWPGLLPALADSGATVLHAHSHRYGHVLQSAAVARRCGIPLVVSTHYHPADRRETAIKRGLLRCQDVLFGASAYRIARALIVETRLEARLVAEFAPSDRIHIIPPGVDLGEWSHPETDPLPAGLPERYLVYAGRIAANKGLDGLVSCLARWPAASRPHLVLVGRDWGEQPRLEGLARSLGVDGSLTWLGHLASRAEYRAVLRAATAFVLPSEWEAYGVVLLEAMAAGTPIVATAVGGVPEVLDGGRAGRLVPYGDVEAMHRALEELGADDRARHDLIRSATARVQGLDWSVAAERHLALYRSLAG